jgi:hypothetical protein
MVDNNNNNNRIQRKSVLIMHKAWYDSALREKRQEVGTRK